MAWRVPRARASRERDRSRIRSSIWLPPLDHHPPRVLLASRVLAVAYIPRGCALPLIRTLTGRRPRSRPLSAREGAARRAAARTHMLTRACSRDAQATTRPSTPSPPPLSPSMLPPPPMPQVAAAAVAVVTVAVAAVTVLPCRRYFHTCCVRGPMAGSDSGQRVCLGIGCVVAAGGF